jgi:hypothetical protein
MRVSLLVPTRNDADKALRLVSDLHDYVDDIVLLDSSEGKERQKLLDARKKFRKLKLLYVVAMGYPEPVFKYGMNACRNEWVLLLGTDERLNDAMKKELRSIPRSNVSAFTVKRYEAVHLDGTRTPFFTWQVRLFRKSRTFFKGLLHEQPIVKGRISELGGSYAIEHVIEEKGDASHEYNKMNILERFSYETFNERVMDYASKVLVPSQRDIKNMPLGRFIHGLLRTYETAAFKKPGSEISNFDYFSLYFMRDLAYLVKQADIKGMISLTSKELATNRQIREWRSRKDSAQMFEISKIIHRIGITRYLGLESQKNIDVINREYAHGERGVSLLITMLKRKYEQSQRKR